MSGPRRGGRQLVVLASELSERDLMIVASARQLRLLSARHIERLHFPPAHHASSLSAARTCRRSLERLVRDRLLVRLERRIGGLRAGSASFVYALGPVGQRLLKDEGPRRRFREPSALFVAHTLAVSELFVRLHETNQDGRLGLLMAQTEPTCWRTVFNLAGRSVVKPDLYVSLVAGGYEYRWFVEVDLATEHRPAVVRKCLAFEAYYRSGVEQESSGGFPRVLWVAPEAARAAAIQGAIDGTKQLTPGLFLVTTVDQAVEVLAGGPS